MQHTTCCISTDPQGAAGPLLKALALKEYSAALPAVSLLLVGELPNHFGPHSHLDLEMFKIHAQILK